MVRMEQSATQSDSVPRGTPKYELAHRPLIHPRELRIFVFTNICAGRQSKEGFA
jgi:hypothetical protein